MHRRLMLVAVCVLCLSCERAPRRDAKADDGRLKVFVSILPQAYFVKRIGDDHVDVGVLVGPGRSPATYAPTSDQMLRLSRARAFFRIGVPFEEPLMRKIRDANAKLEIVDTRKGIKLRRMEEHHHEGEEAGHHEAHEHETGLPDPHIWLDPKLVKVQAATICEALCRLDPPHAADYKKNLASFDKDLDALDVRIARALKPLRGKTLLVFHPAFGYLADAYGLRQVAIEAEGKDPTSKELVALIAQAKKLGVRVIFVQTQFSTKSAETIAREINGVVVKLDPLAEDYITNLGNMATQIEEHLK